MNSYHNLEDNNIIALSMTLPPLSGEFFALAQVRPGSLCRLIKVTDGVMGVEEQEDVAVEDAGAYLPLFAVENGYMGGTINDVYEIGERVMLRWGRPGDMVLARYDADTVDDVHTGHYLVSGNDGTLRKLVIATDKPGAVVGISLIDRVKTAPVSDLWMPIFLS